jgi:hypothetical protein
MWIGMGSIWLSMGMLVSRLLGGGGSCMLRG